MESKKMLNSVTFKTDRELTNFIYSHNIDRENIQQITYGRQDYLNIYTLFYWE